MYCLFIYDVLNNMTTELYKCCFCLSIVKNPLVMCYQTHVGCFDCVCEHIQKSEKSECPLCRQSLHIRFDRLISESSETLHRPKRRKTTQESAHRVFLRLLQLKNKERYRIFTRTLKRFAVATESSEEILQLSEDITNIFNARKSATRLLEQKLYDQGLHSHVAI